MSFPLVVRNPLMSVSHTPSAEDTSPRLPSHIMAAVNSVITTPREETALSDKITKTAAERAIDLKANTTKIFLDSQGPVRRSLKPKRLPEFDPVKQLKAYEKAIQNAYTESTQSYHLSNYHQRELQKAYLEQNQTVALFHFNRFKEAVDSYNHSVSQYNQLLMTAARKKLIQQKVHQNITPNINANNRNYKTKLCKHHFKGKVCHRARTCTFAHGEHEQVDLKVAKRAIICINFLKNNCLYGVNCYFCHSEAELRQLTMRLKERVI